MLLIENSDENAILKEQDFHLLHQSTRKIFWKEIEYAVMNIKKGKAAGLHEILIKKAVAAVLQ